MTSISAGPIIMKLTQPNCFERFAEPVGGGETMTPVSAGPIIIKPTQPNCFERLLSQ